MKDAKKRDLTGAHRVIEDVAGKLLHRPAADFEGTNFVCRKEAARIRKACDLLNSLIEGRQKAFCKLERNLAMEEFANLKKVSAGSGPILYLQQRHRLPDFAEREAALARA